jgi:sugar/nucleoside kinase (ribokinase family)
VLHVASLPIANHGAVVHRATSAVAGDAPIVALACAHLGLGTMLVSNPVGSDVQGRRLAAVLASAGVDHRGRHDGGGGATPELTVVSDSNGTRTWFAHLDPALSRLARTDLAPLATARLAYIDGYTIIAELAARAIVAAAATPVLLNLGGDDLHPVVEAAARRCRLVAVQTSLDESEARYAETLAKGLSARLDAERTIVTLGSLGALALTPTGTHRVPSPDVPHPQTHGAGAAFSAGYLHALTQGDDHLAAVHAACRSAAAACAAPAHEPDADDPAATMAI